MTRFIPLCSSLDAVIYIHAAGCGKVATKRPGWVRDTPVDVPDAKAAQAKVLADLLDSGRDDIAVKICPCAKKPNPNS